MKTKTILKKAVALKVNLENLAQELADQIPGYDATPELEDVRYAKKCVESAINALENHVT